MLLKHASSVAGWTLLSRLFGFLRDLVMASALGAGPLADAFMVAFRLPNHLRAVLGEGAFNAAFVPTYAAVLEREGQGAAADCRAQILTWVALVNVALLVVALGMTGAIVRLLAPGFADEPARFALTVELTRITFPYLLRLSTVTLLTGVLNAHGRFAAGAAAPILLNLAMTAALLSARHFPDAGHAAAVGVLAGGVVQLALLLLAVWRAGLSTRLSWPRASRPVRTFARRFGPAVLGAGGVQIAVFADTVIASLLPAGSISYLYYADRLYQLPLAVIGIALGTAILPALARRVAAGDEAGAARELGRGLAVAVVAGVPCAVVLALLGDWILSVLFARGAFGPADVLASARALAAYSVGLPAAIMLRPIVAALHARGDTATPVKALLVATLVNVLLKLVLVAPLRHAGLAAATSVGVWIYALLLLGLLWRRGFLGVAPYDRLLIVGGLVGSTAAGAAIVLGRDAFLQLSFVVPASPMLVPLGALVGLGSACYAVVAAAVWLIACLSRARSA
ncbi:putative peptidoglycan lipid II flippase [Tistlia consotensis]|uniref:Probable lipid II flippase MurJ n=1 Tax=Tistlia consotensis USBA 355 TaxID=560819 RepID=A0A1Y6CWY7_9PROT|nr:murein biosynthesis integral membrane protein MurJ [Tistlia consotensis]SMF84328.1 putative peptidoglycan lipid II flippase [Tistlia consotensis USBA 355]SNS36897.1 putative peptidoglycan lipid II flippase [Tistlia consotensis]